MTEEELAKHDSKTLLQLLLSADARCEALTAERDRLLNALTALHKQALMLRGEKSYREFARAVEKQARAALKGKTP